MANRQYENKKVTGLALQSNSFAVPEGAYERLDNCVVTQDNIIKKRRGYSEFYDVGGVVMARNLCEYQDKILDLCDGVVQVYTQNADGSFNSVSTLGGAPFSIPAGKKGRYVQSNGNLYFTADEGIFKVESTTAPLLEAGIDPATDLQVFLLEKSAAETFFRPDSQISYRILFGRRDANNNVVIGAPSQIVSTTNPIRTDSATLAVTTVTVAATAHGLAVSDVIYVVNADSDGIPDGNYTVDTTPDANHFTFTANSGTAGTVLSWGTFKTVSLDAAIPSGITTEFFYRIYRTSVSAAEDIPADESTLQLVDEQNLTTEQISTGFFIYVDSTPDILRGEYLYTNPNTGEPRGILEANEKPPMSQDVALFNNHVFYANVETPFNLTLNLISSNSTTMPNGAEFTITQGMIVEEYKGYLQPRVGNLTVRATSVSFVLTDVTINYNAHGFNNGDIIAVAQALDVNGNQLSTLPQGDYVVSGAGANSFHITAPMTPTGLVNLSFAGVETAAGERIFYIEDSDLTSVASALSNTARGIVRAINRNTASAVSAYYVSPTDGIPGKMVFRTKETTATFTVNAVTAAIVDSFNPPLPLTGNDVIGTRDDGQGQLYFSKPGEPEAVPLVNNITVGSKSAAILRIAPLRDSLIVLKEDGVFRINGDSYSNFVATILDSTVILKATDSVATLNNQVFCCASQGIVAVSETAAQIISRDIEPVFTAVVGKTAFNMQTHALSYESERLYLIATISPTSETTNKVYVYNHLTSAWSTWNSATFLDGIIKTSDDKMYYINLDNTIFRERKNQNRLDYTDRSYPATVTTVLNVNQAVLNISGSVGAIGDVVVFNNIISRIIAVEGSGVNAVYTFANNISFEATDNVTLYKYIVSEIRTAPFYQGTMSDLKQFSELQGDFRNKGSCTSLKIFFVSDSVSSGLTDWESTIQTQGWGEGPWGLFEWGDEDGINLPFETTSSQPLRTYIPIETQRGTYIQANMTHAVAAQNIMLQNVAFTSRIYKQRTTR